MDLERECALFGEDVVARKNGACLGDKIIVDAGRKTPCGATVANFGGEKTSDGSCEKFDLFDSLASSGIGAGIGMRGTGTTSDGGEACNGEMRRFRVVRAVAMAEAAAAAVGFGGGMPEIEGGTAAVELPCSTSTRFQNAASGTRDGGDAAAPKEVCMAT